jgi:hypothetical protein
VVHLAAALLFFISSPPVAVQTNANICEAWVVFSHADALVDPHGHFLRARLEKAVTLFRFNKKPEALGKLDAAIPMVTGIVDSRVSREQREELLSRIRKLRDCLDRTAMPKLARLMIRSRFVDQPRRGVANAAVTVEGIPAGHTNWNGVVSVWVPSGQIYIRAVIPPNVWGDDSITLKPAAVKTLTVNVSDDKEVVAETRPVVMEAIEDVVPADSRTLTIKFIGEEGVARVIGIQEVELRDPLGNFVRDLTESFELVDGWIVARDARALLKQLTQSRETVSIWFVGGDIDAFYHAGTVKFSIR